MGTRNSFKRIKHLAHPICNVVLAAFDSKKGNVIHLKCTRVPERAMHVLFLLGSLNEEMHALEGDYQKFSFHRGRSVTLRMIVLLRPHISLQTIYTHLWSYVEMIYMSDRPRNISTQGVRVSGVEHAYMRYR